MPISVVLFLYEAIKNRRELFLDDILMRAIKP